MALTLARALLPLMAVTMVTVAAPLAERAGGEEMAVAALGDSNAVDVAKRAKEEIVFGNQQNSIRLGAAKKSMEPEQQLLSQTQEAAQAAPAQLPAANEQDKAHEPEQPAVAEDVAKDEANQPLSDQGSEQPKESAAEKSQGSEGESAGPEDQPSSGEQESQPASDQPNPAESEESEDTPQPADQQSSSEEAKEEVKEEEEEEEEVLENEPQPVPVEGGEQGTGEQVQEEEEEEKDGEEAQLENNDVPLIPVQEGGVLTAPEGSSESDRNDDTPPSSESPAEDETDQNLLPPDAGGDSPTPDSEAALQALDQSQPQDAEVDDVEGLLQDLHNGAQGEEASSAGEGEEKVDEEGNAERELMQVTNQAADGNSADSEYRQSLLKYILSHGDEYGRIPQANPILYSTDPYYLQRRRRSLAARSPFPHIHRRRQHNEEKALSRAKRTKRDLFDDNLYYNVDLPYDREQEEEEQEEAEKDEELQELITYLMALYPALYPNDRPTAQFPAYLWQGPKYPEDQVEEEEEEEEEQPYWGAELPAYEEPAPAWEEPEFQDLSPAWEPSFYPEQLEEEEQEEEEPEFYPVAAKREMMSFVPGQRRKRYFFPFAREPYTHWGAFVPSQQKREYYEEEEEEDPYQRLRELAMVLAEDRQQPSYFDTLDDYKKK